MQKRLIWVIFFFFTTSLFGVYDIKLGIYSDVNNLRASIVKVRPYTFRKKIKVRKKGQYYYLYVRIQADREKADRALRVYRKVFKDAFIADGVNAVKKKHKKKRVSKQKKQMLKKSLFKSRVSRNKKNLKSFLFHKSIYMCYEDGPGYLEHRIVQIHFHKNLLSYLPLSLEKKVPLKIPYKIRKETIFLRLSDVEIVHKVMEKKESYLHIQSYVKKHKMYTLRYFFDKEHALAYIGKK